VRLLLNKQIQDSYLSVWLKGSDHWKKYVELGRILSKYLNLPVRCDPGAEYPRVSPHLNIFLEISKGAEKLVNRGQANNFFEPTP
jgi:hypothetical protein